MRVPASQAQAALTNMSASVRLWLSYHFNDKLDRERDTVSSQWQHVGGAQGAHLDPAHHYHNALVLPESGPGRAGPPPAPRGPRPAGAVRWKVILTKSCCQLYPSKIYEVYLLDLNLSLTATDYIPVALIPYWHTEWGTRHRALRTWLSWPLH